MFSHQPTSISGRGIRQAKAQQVRLGVQCTSALAPIAIPPPRWLPLPFCRSTAALAAAAIPILRRPPTAIPRARERQAALRWLLRWLLLPFHLYDGSHCEAALQAQPSG